MIEEVSSLGETILVFTFTYVYSISSAYLSLFYTMLSTIVFMSICYSTNYYPAKKNLGKGYVDFSDYRRIYTNSGMDTDTDTDSTGRYYNQGPGSFPHKDLSLSQIGDEDRRKLLKR